MGKVISFLTWQYMKLRRRAVSTSRWLSEQFPVSSIYLFSTLMTKRMWLVRRYFAKNQNLWIFLGFSGLLDVTLYKYWKCSAKEKIIYFRSWNFLGESDLDNKFSDWQWLIEVLNKCPKNDISEFEGPLTYTYLFIYLPWNKGSLFILLI